jgi:hypothetical protein
MELLERWFVVGRETAKAVSAIDMTGDVET